MKRRFFLRLVALCALPALASGQFATFQDRAFLAGPPVTATDAAPRDDMESYSDLADVNGLNGGTGWGGAYVSRGGDISVHQLDTMDTYDSENLNGLNGGSGWAGAYVDR